ncbi:MAG: hypothetical protein JSV75_03860 [Candidatus Bathyarchaeota archaeon]|nr:MAG: hypothetical protein JSV75_03860 [Candidatus Bathyarchaeota archaeon]
MWENKLLKPSQILEEIKTTEESTRKRLACASCGSTWIELVGHVVWHRDKTEDIHLQIGMESENCQTCRFRRRQCKECGSKDVYEIMFLDEIATDSPLSFKEIKRVSRARRNE